MSNYVLKYSRDERVKYISHLDFVRMFHRAVRRSGLEMTFSCGFNPHPVMTVACPLPVGMTADGELLSIGIEGGISPEEVKDRLNRVLPPGFSIKAAECIGERRPDFASIDRARYIIELEAEGEFDAEAFLAKKELTVPKKTKSGVKDTDIRPMIKELSVIQKEPGYLKLEAELAAGNNANLKAETLVAAMEKYSEGFTVSFFTAHRSCLLSKGSGKR